MPRAPRIEFAGACYHVMNRGDHLERIFKDDTDREQFLQVLGETAQSCQWKVHSFVLMPNHYHLLIETLRPTLVKGMQFLNGTYTQRYNVRHKQRGHLFQGRYKALLVDVENKGYFLTVSDYIHLNPIRAKILRTTKELFADPWSSSGWLAGVRKSKPEWLEWNFVYGELGIGRWDRKGRKKFRSYLERRMSEEMNPEINRKIRRGWCLGAEGFIQEMKDRLEDLRQKKDRGPESWSGPLVEEAEEDRAEKLIQEALRRLKHKDSTQLQGLDRYLIAKFVRRHCKVRVQWLANRFGVQTRGGMSHMIYWLDKRLQNDPALKKRWKLLLSYYAN